MPGLRFLFDGRRITDEDTPKSVSFFLFLDFVYYLKRGLISFSLGLALTGVIDWFHLRAKP